MEWPKKKVEKWRVGYRADNRVVLLPPRGGFSGAVDLLPASPPLNPISYARDTKASDFLGRYFRSNKEGYMRFMASTEDELVEKARKVWEFLEPL